MKSTAVATCVALVCFALAGSASAQQLGMPNPREMSGVPLPVGDVPIGTVSVRVIRGTFDNNVVGAEVEFDINGERRIVRTNDAGRAEVSGLEPGTQVKAATTVDGERLESQVITMGASGFRVMLVGEDPGAAKREADAAALAASPAVKGMVVLGPESRVIAQMADDRLEIFYVLEILNTARTPVDIGGPLIFELPREARGATILPESSPQATANGPRVTVTGPFAPGTTLVQAAYELPYSGGTATLEQTWPATLQQLTLLVPQIGGLDVASPQLESKREVADRGEQLIVGMGPAIPAGSSLTVEISGLPHHPRWPRNVALSLAGVIVFAGLWAAFFTRPQRVGP